MSPLIHSVTNDSVCDYDQHGYNYINELYTIRATIAMKHRRSYPRGWIYQTRGDGCWYMHGAGWFINPGLR